MFKRANKITSLLVATSAIVSIIPATGVNAASYEKIDSQEGTIYKAVAYKDGTFYIDGDTEDVSEEGAYYLNGGDYNELDNVDSGSNISIYGSKYLNVDSGSYYVDLSSGKVTDDDLSSDNKDDASMALKKSIKSDAEDRYTDYAVLKSDLKEIPGAKFGDTWYQTFYTTSNKYVDVYTDIDGNYIDAGYNVGKIKVLTASNKTVSLTNTNDTEDGTTVAISSTNVIGQDASNIYRTAIITVACNEAITEINGVNVTGTAFNRSSDGKTVNFSAIQKISKDQSSDNIDGAKYAKTVNTYVVSDEDGAKATILNSSAKSIVDGKVIAYTNSSGSVTVQTIDLKSVEGYYYTDITDVDSEDAVAIDTDASGNLWRLKGGVVYEFDNDEDWNEVYKVDGSMNNLSVYDKDNMVVWNQDDKVYSIIGQMAPDFSPYVKLATIQISCAAILSAILCPFIVQWIAKRFGCPKYEENFGENPKELVG